MLQQTTQSDLLALPEKSSLTIRQEYIAAKAEAAGRLAQYLFSTKETDRVVLEKEMIDLLPPETKEDPQLLDVISTVTEGMDSLKEAYKKLESSPPEALTELLLHDGSFAGPIKLELTPLAVVCYLSESDYHKRSETSIGLSLRQPSLGNLAGRLILVNLGTTKERSDGKQRPDENIERTRTHELLHALSYLFNPPVDPGLFTHRLKEGWGEHTAELVRDALLFKTWTESLAYYGSGLTHVDVPFDEYLGRAPERLGTVRADLRTEMKGSEYREALDLVEKILTSASFDVLTYDELARSICTGGDVLRAIGALLITKPQEVDELFLALGLHPHTEEESTKKEGMKLRNLLKNQLQDTLGDSYERPWTENEWTKIHQVIEAELKQPQSRNWYPTEEIDLRPFRMLVRYADSPELIAVAVRAIERLSPLVTDYRELSMTSSALKQLQDRVPPDKSVTATLKRVEERLKLLRAHHLIERIDECDDSEMRSILLRHFVDSMPPYDATLWNRSFFPREFISELRRDPQYLLMILERSPCCIRSYDAALLLRKVLKQGESRVSIEEVATASRKALAYFEDPSSFILQRQNLKECLRVIRELSHVIDGGEEEIANGTAL